MRTRRKLLNSALILGLTLGNLNGTVVQAVTVLNNLGMTQNRPVSNKQKKDEAKSVIENTKNSKEENKNSSKTSDSATKKEETNSRSLSSEEEKEEQEKILERLLNPRYALDIPDSIQVAPSINAIRLGEFLVNEMQKGIDAQFNTENDNLSVNDTMIFRNVSPIFYYSPSVNTPGTTVNNLSPLRANSDSAPRRVFRINAISRSGNWRMEITPTESSTAQSLELGEINVVFTRLRVAPPQEEIFEIPRFLYSYYWYIGPWNEAWSTVRMATEFKFDFSTTNIGDLQANVKSGRHTLGYQETVPDPESYVDVQNSRGDVSYRWLTEPDTNKIGKQQVQVEVSDQTGRSPVIVNFDMEVLPLITTKEDKIEVYQNDPVPALNELFDVHYQGSYQLSWITPTSTTTPGSFVWQARVLTQDGREATASVNAEVMPDQGIMIELHPIRAIQLGNTSSLLNNNAFRDLIKSATFRGTPLDIDSLRLVASESSEPDYQTAGEHQLRLTVEGQRPDVNVRTTGTIATTVNVRWDNTILMKSINGQSAGAFSLLLSNSDSNNIPLRITNGLATDMDASVGRLTSPFSTYYSIQIMRNNNVIYNQEMSNRTTLQQIIDQFGNTDNIFNVQLGDVIRIHHPERSANSSVLMMNEEEHDFTYGTEYAYYEVTSSGFRPAPVMEAQASQKNFALGENTSNIDPGSLIDYVTINGRRIDNSQYTVE